MFEHRCLRRNNEVRWKNFVSSSEFRRKILNPTVHSLEQVLSANRLIWLKHVLRMPAEQLPRYTLFSETRGSWRMIRVTSG